MKLQPQQLYVFYFHRVSNEQSLAYPPLKPEAFSTIIHFIKNTFEVVDFRDLNPDYQPQKPLAILTFDDGFHDFAEFAFPILNDNQLPVTLNIITECAETGLPNWTQKVNCLVEAFANQNLQPEISGINFPKLKQGENEEQLALLLFRHLCQFQPDEIHQQIKSWELKLKGDFAYTPMLKWDEIKQLTDTGLVLPGCHTKTHLNLAERHSPETLTEEIINTKLIIEEKLKCKVDRFAFPNGLYNQESMNKVKDAGYDFILLTGEKTISKVPESKPYIFPRIEPFYDSLSENLFKIAGFHSMIGR